MQQQSQDLVGGEGKEGSDVDPTFPVDQVGGNGFHCDLETQEKGLFGEEVFEMGF